MKDIFLAVAGFATLMLFIVFAVWFGAIIITIAFVSAVVLIAYLKLSKYYMAWKYKNTDKFSDSFVNVEQNTDIYGKKHTAKETTIIDVEYQEISDKKP